MQISIIDSTVNFICWHNGMKNDQSITEEKPMKYRYQCYDNLFKKPSCLELKLQFEKQSIKICTHFFFHFKAL